MRMGGTCDRKKRYNDSRRSGREMPRRKDTATGFKNRTIFTGDNLHVMRGMGDECIDLIYLDPPFNSHHNYAAPIGSRAAGAAFKDTWTLNDIDEAWWGMWPSRTTACTRHLMHRDGSEGRASSRT